MLVNLAQEASQSKPPLMYCADWAYNIIPAVTAMGGDGGEGGVKGY